MDKPKRGRPRTNGLKSAQTLYRALLIIEGYQQSRLSGKPHRKAVQESVDWVKRHHPGMRVSTREVDRVLAKWHSSKREASVIVKREVDQIPIFDGKQFVEFVEKEVLAFGFAPDRPKYPKRPRKLPKLKFSGNFK